MEAGFALGLDGLKAWCDRNNVKYLENEQLGQLGIPTPLGQNLMIRVIPRPDRNMVTFALPLPVRVPPALVQEVARATALANSGLFMGAWVLHHGKGELYYRLSVPTEGVAFNDEAVLFLLNVTVGTVRGVGEGFRQIIQAGASAESIVAHMSGAAGAATAEAATEEAPEEG